jgi:hypothetical protein
LRSVHLFVAKSEFLGSERYIVGTEDSPELFNGISIDEAVGYFVREHFDARKEPLQIEALVLPK